MKPNIHPNYEVVTATCVCGSKFETRSTQKTLGVEICSACHPFFTGTQKILDAEGRVQKFQKRYAKTVAIQTEKAEAAEKKTAEKPVAEKKTATKTAAKVKKA